MIKLNKKGFTLIELLAVVVILLAISVIAVSSISAAIERNKVKQNNTKKEIIISYAKLYYEEHKNSEGDMCIELSKLDLSDTEKVDTEGETLSGVVKYKDGSWQFVEKGSCEEANHE